MKQLLCGTLVACTLALPLSAQDMVTYTTDQSFDDVMFGLENAIINQGLVIDATSHVGDMLERTKGDVGAEQTLYIKADVLSFCSATVSRAVMEADPMNIAYCPYNIFVAVSPDQPDQTMIGFRTFPEGAMQQVQTLLDTLARTAIGE